MNDNDGYICFTLYNGIKTHFSSKSYDFIKYHGKTNVSKESFLKRRDKYSFFKAARKYSLDDVKNYFIANIVYRDAVWIGDMLSPEGEDAYKLWQKNNQSLQYKFKNDIITLLEKYDDPESMLKVVDGQHPPLLEEMIGKNIMFETVTILNDLMGFFKVWDKKINDDVIWPEYKLKCEKYAPFIVYDKAKFKEVLKEQL